MSRRFRYWTRCALVLTLTILITFNPAWAGRGLRGWIKKRHRCCGVVAWCSPVTTCVPVQPACCGEVVHACSTPVASSCDCCESAASTWGHTDGVTVTPSTPSIHDSESKVSPKLAPDSILTLPPVETQSPTTVLPEVSPSDTSESKQSNEKASGEPKVSDEPKVQPATPEAEVTKEPATVEKDAPANLQPAEPEVPATNDVFGNDMPLPADEPSSDDALFDEPEAAEQESTAPSEMFDDPADPFPSKDDTFDGFQTEPSEDLPKPSDSSDDLFGTEGGDPATPANPSEAPSDLFESTTESAPNTAEDLFGETSSGSSRIQEQLDQRTPSAEGQAEADLFAIPADPANETRESTQSTDSIAPSTDSSIETPQIPSVDAEDDLFGNPPEGQKKEESEEEEVDLFGLDTRRTWRDNTGKFEVEATLAEIHVDHVRLLKSNGKFCKVPLRRLSAEDRAVVELIVSTLPPGGKTLVSITAASN